MKIMRGIFPSQSPAHVEEYPRLSLCLLYPDFIPMKSPDTLPQNWSASLLLDPILSNEASYSLNADDGEDLMGELFESIGMLGIPQRACWLAKNGHLALLSAMTDDIDTTLELEDLFDCPQDLLASPILAEILSILRECFSKRFAVFGFWTDVLRAAIEAGNFGFVRHNWTVLVDGELFKADLGPLLPIMPIELIRDFLEMGEFSLELPNEAVSANRLDIVKLVYEYGSALPSLEAIGIAIANASSEIIDFLEAVAGTDALRDAILSMAIDEKLLEKIIHSGNVQAFKVLIKYIPEFLSLEHDLLAIANSIDHLELIQFIYVKVLDDVDPQLLSEPSPERAQVMAAIIGHVSGNYAALYAGKIKLAWFFKGECAKYGVPFPEVTPQVIFNALKGNCKDFFDSYERIFGQPIPHLDIVARRVHEIADLRSWHLEVFHKRHINVYPSGVQVQKILDVESLKYIHQRYPWVLDRKILESKLCSALSRGLKDTLEWISTFQGLPKQYSCDYVINLEGADKSVYQFAATYYPKWLPSQDDMDFMALNSRHSMVRWLWKISKGALYPSADILETLVEIGDILMLRLVDSLRPFSPAIIQKLFEHKDNPLFTKWFPRYLSP